MAYYGICVADAVDVRHHLVLKNEIKINIFKEYLIATFRRLKQLA
jgi:hypothetical protein